MVESGANLRATTCIVKTPRHLAAGKGHDEVCKNLVDAGADLKARNCQGFTSLHVNVDTGHFIVMEALLEGGAELEALTSIGNTPLHLKILAAFLTAGAHYEATNCHTAAPGCAGWTLGGCDSSGGGWRQSRGGGL